MENLGYNRRKSKDFEAWSNVIKEALTTSCVIEGQLMSSHVCCACNKNIGEIRCLDCCWENTYCKSCARETHKQWKLWTHLLEIKKVSTFVLLYH